MEYFEILGLFIAGFLIGSGIVLGYPTLLAFTTYPYKTVYVVASRAGDTKILAVRDPLNLELCFLPGEPTSFQENYRQSAELVLVRDFGSAFPNGIPELTLLYEGECVVYGIRQPGKEYPELPSNLVWKFISDVVLRPEVAAAARKATQGSVN